MCLWLFKSNKPNVFGTEIHDLLDRNIIKSGTEYDAFPIAKVQYGGWTWLTLGRDEKNKNIYSITDFPGEPEGVHLKKTSFKSIQKQLDYHKKIGVTAKFIEDKVFITKPISKHPAWHYLLSSRGNIRVQNFEEGDLDFWVRTYPNGRDFYLKQ